MTSEHCCIDCKSDYPLTQMVILPNRLWAYIADTYDNLCVSCIQVRLGRKLKPSDFPDRIVTVYRGQRMNIRTIPINIGFFKLMGWKMTVWRKKYYYKRKVNQWRNEVNGVRK